MKTIKVSRERAIIIASNHNNTPLEKAKSYTDRTKRGTKTSEPQTRILNLNSNTSSPKQI